MLQTYGVIIMFVANVHFARVYIERHIKCPQHKSGMRVIEVHHHQKCTCLLKLTSIQAKLSLKREQYIMMMTDRPETQLTAGLPR